MDDFVESIYLEELAQQCAYGLGAIERLNDVLRGLEGGRKPAELFLQAGYFLQHAAAVSRLLFPPPKGKARAIDRGAHLRKSLGVHEDHPLANRDLRDHFEHYDERIDDWAEKSVNQVIVDYNISPRGQIGGDAIADADIMRHYDRKTKMLIFRGDPFNIEALANGVADIKERAEKRLRLLGERA